jgi:hypothetical protein
MANDESLSIREIQSELRAENPTTRALNKLVPSLVSAFVSPDTPIDAALELVVTVNAENLPTREFASYLALIDRLYGRLSPGGIRSYAHSASGHLLISDIHRSELEIIFRTLYQETEHTAVFIAILLFLRSLPNMFKLGTEGVRNLAEAYKSYEEGRLTRENRKHIRETITDEPSLENLDESKKKQLVKLLDTLTVEENANLPAPVRFARRHIKGIVLRVRKPPKVQSYEPLHRKFALDDSEDEPLKLEK